MSTGPEQETYEIAVEVSALAWESATPLFARYRVPLSGDIDEAWLSCFERASFDSAEFSRFRLDPRTMMISFISRMSDGPAEVAAILRRLELLVGFVNTRARCAGAGPAGESEGNSGYPPGETPPS